MTATIVILTAAPKETEAVAAGLVHAGWVETDHRPGAWAVRAGAIGGARVGLVESGVGLANAGAATGVAIAWALDRAPASEVAVLNLGVGGALPAGAGRWACAIGDVVVSDRSVYGDTGLTLPGGGFAGMGEIGFPLVATGGEGPGLDVVVPPTGPLVPGLAEIERASGVALRRGPIATVASCSASDDAASSMAARTGAIAEAMEGAGVATVAARYGLAWGEVRVISNTTGDRDGQVWDLGLALERLRAVASGLGRSLASRGGSG